MGASQTAGFRNPITSGTYALIPVAGMITSDLYYATDTKVWYCYDGAAWQLVVTSGLKLAGTLTFAADTSKTLSSLTGNKRYMAVAAVNGTNNLILYANGDTTATNYYREYTQISGNAVGADRENLSELSNSAGFFGTIFIGITNQYFTAIAHTANAAPASVEGWLLSVKQKTTSTQITSLTFSSAAAVTGTIKIYEIVD
jgi:hypothetical protein